MAGVTSRSGVTAALAVAAAATAALASLVLVAALAGRGADDYIAFGATTRYPAYAHPRLGDVRVRPDDGHDGQAFWLQAHDPLLVHGEELRPVFDWPSYRAQRVLYPLLVAPFRLGGEWGLAWGLVVVNLAAVFAGTYVTARLAQDLGAPVRAGWAFALNPMVLISLLLDLSDILALALVVLGLLLIRRRRWGWAVAAAVGAVLTKELMILAFVGVALLATSLPLRKRWLPVIVSGAVAAGWALYVRWRLGWPPTQVTQNFTAVPFAGYVDSWRLLWAPKGLWDDAAGAVGVTAFSAWAIWRWVRRRTIELDAALPFVALVPLLSVTVMGVALNFARAVGPAITLAVVDLYAQRAAVSRRDSEAVAVSDGGATDV